LFSLVAGRVVSHVYPSTFEEVIAKFTNYICPISEVLGVPSNLDDTNN